MAKDAANRVTYISRSYGIPDQQPVYKSQIPDGVVFQIAEMRVNNENIYTSNNSKYEICSTKILHSSIEMRYSITAILKDSAEDEKISLYYHCVKDKMINRNSETIELESEINAIIEENGVLYPIWIKITLPSLPI